MRFIERLTSLMKENELNQVKLSKETGIRQGMISAWLLNKYEPTTAYLWRLADYFDVSIDYLVGRAD